MKNLEDIDRSIAYLRLYSADPTKEKLKPIGRATGFLWKGDNDVVLLTNWHVFAGRNHDTGQQIAPALPRYVEIFFSGNGLSVSLVEPLFSEQEEPRWLQSIQLKTDKSAHGDIPMIDIVALPLDTLVNPEAVCAFNELLNSNGARTDVFLEVTTDVSIIGYPFQVYDAVWERPAWVTGRVAQSLCNADDTFLVNAHPYGGMSGAPVLWVYRNRPIKTKNGVMVNSSSGDFVQFGGMYSGRMYEDGRDPQSMTPMARVWAPHTIDQILLQKRPTFS